LTVTFDRCFPAWRALLGAVLAQALVGCVTVPPAAPVVPAAPEAFREGGPSRSTPSTPLPADGWWRVFADPLLDRLMVDAATGNPGVQQAAARVAQAAALQRAAGAAGRPQLSATAGGSRELGSRINAAGTRGNLFDAGLALQWDLDWLQRATRSEQAAALDLQGQQLLLAQARLSLQAELAQATLSWHALQRERPLLEQAVQRGRELLALADRRQRAGLVAVQAGVQLRQDVQADEADLLQLDRRLALTRHALAALLGQPRAPQLDGAAPAWPGVPPVPAGLPSQMLQRRADVAAADRSLQAARLRAGLARDAWFPSADADGAAPGWRPSDLGQWLRASARNTGLGLLLSLPGLDGGRGEAQRAMAAAQLDLAAAEHREIVVNALRDVEDQLAALRTLGAESAARMLAAQDAERDAEHHHAQWRQGLGSEVDAVQARRQQWVQARHALRAQAAERVATVMLVRALGGGWVSDTPSAQGH
jgi:multidrug efflux system outer membrane protein